MAKFFFRILSSLICIFALGGCSVYSKKFASAPAEGLFDTSLHAMDELLVSQLLDKKIADECKSSSKSASDIEQNIVILK